MIKILITAGSFTGSVVVIYGTPEVVGAPRPLLSIDMSNAQLTDQRKQYLLSNVPLWYGDGFKEAWGAGKLIFTEEYEELDFERDFFKPYGYAVNKARCLKEWKKLTLADAVKCAHSVAAYLWHLAQNQWKNKMLPETYIRKRSWETDWYNV